MALVVCQCPQNQWSLAKNHWLRQFWYYYC